MTYKLTAMVACRVAGLDRDRFNEHVAAGRFPCAPQTIPGRARVFNPDDMVALRLFRDLLDDGVDAERAGKTACIVGEAARAYPDAPVIALVQTYVGLSSAHPADEVPAASNWDEALFSGSDIRKVTYFRVSKIRKLNAHYAEEERQIISDPSEGER